MEPGLIPPIRPFSMQDTDIGQAPPEPASRSGFGRWPATWRWALLLVLSLVLVVGLEVATLPAALLLGPMVAGIALGVGQAEIRVPAPLFGFAQAVVGCLVARALPPEVFTELGREWPIYVLGISSVIIVALCIGVVLTRLKVMPGSTAIWGSAPGAASAMVLMADAHGADARLVAFMTYLRVVMVAFAASVVSRIWTGGGEPVTLSAQWLPAVDWPAFAMTMGVVVVGLTIGRLSRIPAGGLLVPLVLGIALQDLAGLRIELPPLLLAVCYALVGWAIGLRFTRPILAHAGRALPAVLLSLLLMMTICAGFSVLLVLLADIDPLTAYLAMSPGGADSVAIIAANTDVDAPFVMAMQAGRMLVLVALGPVLVRWVATQHWLTGLDETSGKAHT